MSDIISTLWDILQIGFLGLAAILIIVIWVVIIVAAVISIFKFIDQYKRSRATLKAEEEEKRQTDLEAARNEYLEP